MTIYEILKRVIGRGGYDKSDLINKMNLYLLYDQLTTEQYDEIMALMV